jgi:hypothetical protein
VLQSAQAEAVVVFRLSPSPFVFRLSENQSVFAEGADVRVGDGKKTQKKVHGGQKLVASGKSSVTKECIA